MESRREVWVERVAGWRRSGLTAKGYAASIGVRAGTLSHWAWRLGQRDQPPMRTIKARVPARLASPELIEVVGRREVGDDGFELRLENGRRLRIPPQFDAPALQRLLDVLEGRL